MKFGCVVFELRERTDRQTDTLITILCTPPGGGGGNYSQLPLYTGAGVVSVGRVAARRSVSTQLCRLLCRARVEQLTAVAIVTGGAEAAVDGRLGVEARALVEARINRARIVEKG